MPTDEQVTVSRELLQTCLIFTGMVQEAIDGECEIEECQGLASILTRDLIAATARPELLASLQGTDDRAGRQQAPGGSDD